MMCRRPVASPVRRVAGTARNDRLRFGRVKDCPRWPRVAPLTVSPDPRLVDETYSVAGVSREEDHRHRGRWRGLRAEASGRGHLDRGATPGAWRDAQGTRPDRREDGH